MNQMPRYFLSMIPALMGIYIIFGALIDMASSSAASEWPKVNGTVTEIRSSKFFLFPESFIAYTYIIDGHEYTGNRINYGGGSASDYYVNGTVDVLYDPDHHNDSALVAGLNSTYFFRIIIGFFFVFVSRLLWRRLE